MQQQKASLRGGTTRQSVTKKETMKQLNEIPDEKLFELYDRCSKEYEKQISDEIFSRYGVKLDIEDNSQNTIIHYTSNHVFEIIVIIIFIIVIALNHIGFDNIKNFLSTP